MAKYLDGAGLGKVWERATPKRIGDVLTTARADLGSAWLLCNGADITKSEYPKLFNILPSSLKNNITATADKSSGLKYKYLNGKHIVCRNGSLAVTDENGTRTVQALLTTTAITDIEYHDGVWAICYLNGFVEYSTDLETWTRVTNNYSVYGNCLKYANGKWIYGARTNGTSNGGISNYTNVAVYFWGDTIETIFSNYKTMGAANNEYGGIYIEEYDGKIFVDFGRQRQYYTEDFDTWVKLGFEFDNGYAQALSMGKAGDYYFFLSNPIRPYSVYSTEIWMSKDLVSFNMVTVGYVVLTIAYFHDYYWLFTNDASEGNALIYVWRIEDITKISTSSSTSTGIYRYGLPEYSTSFPNGDIVYLAGWKDKNPVSSNGGGNSGAVKIEEFSKAIPNISATNAYVYIKAKE